VFAGRASLEIIAKKNTLDSISIVCYILI